MLFEESLTYVRTQELEELRNEYNDVMSDLQGRAALIDHHIRTVADHGGPVKAKSNTSTLHIDNIIKEKVHKMLQLG